MPSLSNTLPKELEVEHRDTETEVALFIGSDIDYFQGHFPQAPILPGVVQLDWAIHFARKFLSMSPNDVLNVEVLKFQVVISPDVEVKLTLTKKSDHKFTFSYQSEKGTHSSGRVVLEEK